MYVFILLSTAIGVSEINGYLFSDI